MKVLYILSWIASFGNAFMQYEKELYMGALGWFCAGLWLTALLIKEFKPDRT